MNALGEERSYETDHAVITVVDEPSSIPHESPSESIESGLPYLEIKTKEEFKYASVFMSESWLLGIVVRKLLSFLSVAVLTFVSS
jgi:hypothetical protein